MSPEEQKAKEICDFFDSFPLTYAWKKQCAIYCVDEILLTCPQKENEIFAISKGMKFWNEVKNHINNM